MSNLPQTVINALMTNDYKKREGYSATTLIKPPQMKALQDRYGDDEKDPIDNLWSVFGTAVHNIMETAASDTAESEVHVAVSIGDTNVHGTIDHYEDGVISDFKVTSAWKYVSGDFDDWEKQLNIYAYLLSESRPVHTLQIVSIFRDWSAMRAKQSSDYPQVAIQVIPIKLWEPEEQYEYIATRLQIHELAKGVADADLPPCTDKERWYTGTKYAVMKRGNKRAVKLYDSEEEAAAHASGDSKLTVEIRPGENKRCEQYCPVASKCKQWRKLYE